MAPDLSFLPGWIAPLDTSFWLAMLLVIAPLAGEAVFRLLRWPRIVGYTLVGLFASASNFDASGLALSEGFRHGLEVAMAVLLFELGSRVHLHWLRDNPWLIATSLAEAGLTFVMVFSIGHYLGLGVGSSIAVAAVCMVSSPAVVMRVASELNARGQVTERLLMLSALNTIYAVLAVQVLLALMGQAHGQQVLQALQAPLRYFVSTFVLALLLAAAVGIARRRLDLANENSVLLLIGLLFLTLVLVRLAGASPILVPLLAGMVLRSRDLRPCLWPRHFGTAGGALVVLLFVVNGMAADWRLIVGGGLVGVTVVVLRAAAKIGGSVLFGRLAGLSMGQSMALGVALLPMSGTAFLLTASLYSAFPDLGRHVAAALAGAATVMEIAGPIATQWALRHCGETSIRKDVHRAA
ncbi:cation:proton antiporter [Zoogloea sp. LCSB751]|uniref:cation:proton antiporter n=1 Tax=Zoogloea sp. LCSB751 TaxID=1965277 RepID=UPI0009A4E984|nr:cation:proton antiporter [Zoogloea sp. LCSB751]